MKVEIKYINPETAEALLSTTGFNRAVSHYRVATLANEMRCGKWQLNGETIIISKSGRLLDGQHRLYAIMESGCTVQMMIATGAPDNSFETIDTGRARSSGDIAGMVGVTNPILVMAAAALIWRLYHHARITEVVVPYVCLRVAERYPALEKWAAFVSAARPRVLPPATFLTALTYFEDVAQKPLAAGRMFKAMSTGADLQDGDPYLALRNRMINLRASGQSLGAVNTWGATARVLSAIERGDVLSKVPVERSGGTIRRPELWPEHIAVMPKGRQLNDLRATDLPTAGEKQKFKENVADIRLREQPVAAA